MGLVHSLSENYYKPGELYETAGRFSLRSPPKYDGFGDDAGPGRVQSDFFWESRESKFVGHLKNLYFV